MKRRHIGGALLLLLAFATVAPTLGEDKTAAVPAEFASDAEVEAAAEVPLVIPAADARRANPTDPTAASLQRGGELFGATCAMCHGAAGEGDGDLALRLTLPVPNFTRVTDREPRTDGELFYIVTHGHGKMPPEDRFSEEWRWDLVNYVRSLERGR